VTLVKKDSSMVKQVEEVFKSPIFLSFNAMARAARATMMAKKKAMARRTADGFHSLIFNSYDTSVHYQSFLYIHRKPILNNLACHIGPN
jgi:hypothetical protein